MIENKKYRIVTSGLVWRIQVYREVGLIFKRMKWCWMYVGNYDGYSSSIDEYCTLNSAEAMLNKLVAQENAKKQDWQVVT